MTGKIVMEFKELDPKGFQMECDVAIRDYSKKNLCDVIVSLCEKLDLTEENWKHYRIDKAVREILAECGGDKHERPAD